MSSRHRVKRIPGTERVYVEGEISWSRKKWRDFGTRSNRGGERRNESGASSPAKGSKERES